MYVRVIFDNKSQDHKLHAGRGLSLLIDERVLFDTGESGVALMENMNTLGVDIEKIKAVVISHDHWDHQGGVGELLRLREGLLIYGCSDMREEWESEIVKTGNRFEIARAMTEISDGLFLSGEIIGKYKGKEIAEQALVIRSEKGLSMLTGCAHPGILKMAEKVKEHFKEDHFYAVIGGMHMLHESRPVAKITVHMLSRGMNVEKIGPTHCSGEEVMELFRQEYRQNFLALEVGGILEV